MLTSEYTHSLDVKNRLFIPAKHREELGLSFMVVQNVRSSCLTVYTMEGWEAYLEPIKKLERKISEMVLRELNSKALKVIPDSQGRILLSQALVDYAQIKKDATMVGCGDYAEIWATEVYAQTIQNSDKDAIRAALEACGL